MKPMLTNNQTKRYSRHLLLPEIGIEGQKKLRAARVLIVGVGGLGCPVAQYLVAAGVGTLGLLDYDRVDISNLHRQILFTETDVDKPKAEAAKAALQKLNQEVEIYTYVDKLTQENAITLFKNYDLVIDGTDNFQAKYLINDACVLTSKAWVYASIYKFQGQLSVFNYKNGPTYRCLFPKVPTQNHSCEETGVLGILPGVLGTLQAAEAMKVILGLGTILSGKLKIVDTLTMQDQLISFVRNEKQVKVIKDRGLMVEAVHCELQDKNKFYLDVREPFEEPTPVAAHLLRIPLNLLNDRYREIPQDQEVYVFCQSGIRSEKAIQLLSEEYGFKNLINVKGGIQTILK
jgi:molybdopterin/thiamine biosynthesis adenylyltransferase/rhodanese-related sulfurtransferase